MTDYFVDYEEDIKRKENFNEDIMFMTYPTVRRIVTENNNIEIVPEVLVDMLLKKYKEILSTSFNAKIDIEAETCLKVCTEYVNKKEE